jgi:hypothetical protein
MRISTQRDERWAMTRIHGTTKQQVRAMFEEERPFLLSLQRSGANCPQVQCIQLDGVDAVEGRRFGGSLPS